MPHPLVQLVLPGLLWPRPLLAETAAGLDLPALSWLLGRARLQWQPPLSLEARLCEMLGASGSPVGNPADRLTEYPLGALRRLAEPGIPAETEDDVWLCADPVHLSVEKRRITLPAQTHPATDDEMQAIAMAFRQHFFETDAAPDDAFEFHPATQGRGYLRLKHRPAIATTPPSAAVGYDTLLPQGPDASYWRRLSNEMQMVLHTLPLNEQREARGKPPLNAIWLCGSAALPEHPLKPLPTRICGNAPLLTGLARWAGVPAQPLTDASTLLAQPATASTLLLLDTLQQATRQYDALLWREALLEVERTWLQPLRRALVEGKLKKLHISALGDEARLDLELTRMSALAFWRRPRPLAGACP